MRRVFQAVLLVFFSCAGLFAQQKYALVIGNGTYTKQPWPNLRNAMNDAADMKVALEKLGFQVDYIPNGNLSQMQTAVINLKQKLRNSTNSYGFFYYAGHGAQNKEGHNYLIPVDAETPSLNLLPQRTLPVQFVLDELEEAKNELNMIVLDACRDVPALERGNTRGLSIMGQIPRGSIVMYATAANKTASDGTGRNGLFTSHLLRNLNTSGLAVTEIFTRTGSDVAKASNGDQYPEIRLMYFETAYLGSKPQTTTTTTVTPQPTPAPAPAVQPAPAPIVQPSPIPANMVRIQGGTFTMGSPANEPERRDNEVQHQVTVSSFYMGRYEVTQKEYQEVTGTNPSNFKGDNLPVEKVSWYDAVEYCNKRSQNEGLTPAYTRNGDNVTWNRGANGYRLPTEAEWEYACRAGTTTPFNTGNNITTSQANYNGNWPYNKNKKGEYRLKTTVVGSFTPNACGLYDMHGNVNEWCWDWYGDYTSGSQTDPMGAVTGTRRVLRGGSLRSAGEYLRSAYRISYYPDYRFYYDGNDYIGFRVVRS